VVLKINKLLKNKGAQNALGAGNAVSKYVFRYTDFRAYCAESNFSVVRTDLSSLKSIDRPSPRIST
jgi:hypothetical protein